MAHPKGGNGGSGNGGKRQRNKKQRQENKAANYAASYGWSQAFLEGHPELKQLFDQAVQHGWTAPRFIAELQDTGWFKKHSDVARKAMYLKATDPKTYAKNVNQLKQQLADAAGGIGVEIPPSQLETMAEHAYLFGWDQNQINNHLAQMVNIQKQNATVGGSLASAENQIKNYAYNNGVTLNDHTMQNWLRQIVRGNSTVEEYQQYITKQAAAAHPNWSKELNSGMSLSDVASPYINSMAQILEIDPSQISVNNKLIRQALSYQDDKGQWKQMTLGDFEDRVRQDPRWMNTDNAKQQYMDIGTSILQRFGLVG